MTAVQAHEGPLPDHVLMTADTVGGVWTYALELARALAVFRTRTTLATLGAPLSAAAAPRRRRRPRSRAVTRAASASSGCPSRGTTSRARASGCSSSRRACAPTSSTSTATRTARCPGARRCWSRRTRACCPGGARCTAATPRPSGSATRRRCARGWPGPSWSSPPAGRCWPRSTSTTHPCRPARVIPNGRTLGIRRRRAEGAADPVRRAPVGRGEEPRRARAGRRLACPGRSSRPATPAATTPSRWSLRRACARSAGSSRGPSRRGCHARRSTPTPRATSRSASRVLEAALAGCALVLGDMPSLREIWEGAALFVDPGDDAAIGSALRRAVRRRRAASLARGQRTRPRARVRAVTHGNGLPGRLRRAALAGLGGAGMRVVIFCHSVLSDWNNGNAHFLRGVATELVGRGHEVRIYEPRDGWSVTNLVTRARRAAARVGADRLLDAAPGALRAALARPRLGAAGRRRGARARVERAGAGARDRAPARAAGRLRAAVPRHPPPRGHRAPQTLHPENLAGYDGVLAFGSVLRELYLVPRLGAARVHLARGRRHAGVPAAARDPEGGRPRLDRQLGRRGAQRRAPRVPARAGAPAAAARARPRRALPRRGAARAARRRRSSTPAGSRTTSRRARSPRSA